ncbi:MAG: undecaprenyldiphospho-muramoylpentapeptide beta-N-acetylglucosaminyltransferase [Fusobacteriaceae bacterium]|jgi:UDP-N-acetylglucosamine--N-acetylmuramyl-(pentapeptide) pyrophosphoryl-undecaprenol N-acetylglucosamine transferase|nr:undecaprenyldiphospho-muramoylpentapeptide beta-N-acetylglucosaminyltransferase [Fusobacteriaceae bacterium]
MNKKVLITTGGTGGHIYPALAVAEELRDKGIPVLFVGSDSRMEKDIVPREGFPFVGLRIRPPRNLRNILIFITALAKGFWLVLKEKPDAVIGFGNYISVPCVLAGLLLRKKVYLQEQNATIGGANKFFYHFCDKTFLAFGKTYDAIPYKYQKKMIIAGNPLRREIYAVNPAEEKEKLKIETEEKVLVVTGGSLGARAINEGVLRNWEEIFENKKLRLYWATGEDNYEEISEKLTRVKISDTIKPYFNNMIHIMSAADLVVCRAGALTISEIIELEKPSIIIPYSSKKVGQSDNAEILQDNESALVFHNHETEKAIGTALEIIHDSERLIAMRAKIKNLKGENAARKIVENLDIWRNA